MDLMKGILTLNSKLVKCYAIGEKNISIVSSTWGGEAGRLQVQDQSQLSGEFWASLGYTVT